VSGPVTPADAAPVGAHGETGTRCVELFESRTSQVGDLTVRRALPRRQHRTVGAWCFADHMGPVTVSADHGVDIGPHPHIGLQTVTWLLAGELLHRDSLGSEQVITAGQLNLMTAGAGVAHAEESTGRGAGDLHGIQLWVAQPESTRDGAAAFEHHAELPVVDLERGSSATVFVGDFAGVVSLAHRDTDHAGVDVTLHGATGVPLRRDYEYALVVLDGAVDVEGTVVEPGHLAYLGTDRADASMAPVNGDARAILLGGVPFAADILMWWNFVARTTDEVDAAYESWRTDDGRFGSVDSPLARIEAPRPMWSSAR
jgi:hypothetical protein